MKLTRRIEDQILLLKIKHGDQAAFASIYDRYVDALFRFVLFRVRNEEVAKDLVSDLFLKVWQYLVGGEAKVTNLRAFLYQVARNLIADHYRDRASQETLPLEEAMQVVGGGETQLKVRLSLAEVEKALKQLSPEWQEVILLAYVEGLKHSEIALIIGKSHAATRVMIHRAMQELKRILNRTT